MPLRHRQHRGSLQLKICMAWSMCDTAAQAAEDLEESVRRISCTQGPSLAMLLCAKATAKSHAQRQLAALSSQVKGIRCLTVFLP